MTNKVIDPFTNKEFDFVDPFAKQELKSSVTTEKSDGVGAAFGSGVDKAQEIGYRALKGFTQVGNEGNDFFEKDGLLSEIADDGIKRNLEEQQNYQAPVASYKDVDGVGKAYTYASHLVAGSIPYMLAAANPASAFGLAGGLSQEAYEAQPEGEKSAVRAIASGGGQMLLERIGIKGSLGDLGKDILRDGVIATAKNYGKKEIIDAVKDGSFAKRILKGAAWEGITEAGQEALAMWGAGADLEDFKMLDHVEGDENYLGVDGQRLMESFVGGVTVGGVMRTGSEQAQRLMSWHGKAKPIAKNGVVELVKQGIPLEQAADQVHQQLVHAGIKQGLSEAGSAAAAARIMKEEYGIEHEIFQPMANDVKSRREAMNVRLNEQRIDAGIGEVQQSLNGEQSLTPSELIQQQINGGPQPEVSELEQMEQNDPAFFEQLDQLDEEKVNNITNTEESLPQLTKTAKGRTYNYFKSTNEKDGIKTTSFSFNRSDKGEEQRNKALVPVDGVLDSMGYAIPNEHIPNDSKPVKIAELREGEQGSAATILFETKDGDTFQGEVQLSKVNNLTDTQEKLPTHNYKGKDKQLIDTFGDSLLTQAVIQRGGLNRESFEQDGDLFKVGANFKNGVIGKPFFPKTGGMTADEFVEWAGEQGVNFEYGNDGVAYVQDLISKAGTDGAILSAEKQDEKYIAEQQEQAIAHKNQSDIQFTQQILDNIGENDAHIKQIADNVITHFGNGKNLEQAIDVEIANNPDNAAIFIDKLLAEIDKDINNEQQTSGIAEEKSNVGAEESGISQEAPTAEQIEAEATAIFGEAKAPEPDKQQQADLNKDSQGSFFTPEESESNENQSTISDDNTIESSTGKTESEAQAEEVNFTRFKTPEERVEAWFNIKGGETIIDIKGKNRGKAFDSPSGRVIMVRDEKGNTNKINAVSVAGKEGIIKAIDKALASKSNFDKAAHEAATSPKNDLAEPTTAQAEANNYKLGRGEHSGFKIGIENPQGSYRKGVDSDGKEWSNKINHHYGDITGTKGADGDALDVFVKPGTENSDHAYVVDQVNSDGSFDEHKIMLGFDSLSEAKKAYLSNYDKGWQGLKAISKVDIEDFREWTKKGDTTKPFASDKAIDDHILDKAEKKGVTVIRAKSEVAREVDVEPISKTTFDSFTSAKGAAEWLEVNAKEPVFREIAAKLKKVIGGDMGITYKGDGTKRGGVLKGQVRYKEDAQGNVTQNEIEIYDQGLTEATLTHELIHGATWKVISNPQTLAQKEAVEQLVAVKREIDTTRFKEHKQWETLTASEKEKFRAVGLSLDEFVTYSLTNPEYQSGLKKLSAKVGDKTLFSKLAGAIKQLLGVKNVDDTLFSRAIDASSAVIESATPSDKSRDIAPAVVINPVESSNQPPVYGEGFERITHTTKKGKELTGIVDNSLSRDEAKAIDPYSFRKGKDGWFIREERIEEHNEKNLPTKSVDKPVDKAIDNPFIGSDARQFSGSKISFTNQYNESFTGELLHTQNDGGILIVKVDGLSETGIKVKPKHLTKIDKLVDNSTQGNKSDPQLLGKNEDGDNVYEDKHGVRSIEYSDAKGILSQEPVSYNPNGDIRVKPVSEKSSRYLTTSESNSEIIAEPAQVNDTKDIADTAQGTQNETDTSDNQNVTTGQQPDLPANDLNATGSRDSSVSENDSSGNGNNTKSNGSGSKRSSDRSDKYDPEASRLNLDDVSNIANGTESERVAANLDAIRLLKKIQSENRRATLEEKAVLSRYVGWGGLKSVIDPRTKKKFAQEANAELKALLTKDEFNGVSASITTAFYTSKDIVKAMWSGVESFGLGKSAMNVIEPSVGTGNFIGWQPNSLRKNSNWSATEIDTVTGNIAKLIYDDSNINVTGYQEADFKEGVFSLAIGNPPFGSLAIKDNRFTDISGMSIHNYMIAKSSKLLHDNGLLMMVVTSRFLDTQNKNHAELSKSMDFVGAVRLPNTAFKSNAGTEVTTDVVVFRKLKKGEKAKNTIWTDTNGKVNDVKINKYFEQNQQNILGEVSGQGTMYGDSVELTVNPIEAHSDINASLSTALAEMAQDVDLSLTNQTRENIASEVMLTKSELGIGGMMIDGKGDVWRREDDVIGLGAQVNKVTPKTIWRESGVILEEVRQLGKDKEALMQFAKEKLINTATGKFKSSYKSAPFAAMEKYLAGDLAFGTFRGKLLKALDSPTGPRLGAKNYQKLKHILTLRNTALELIKAEKQDLPHVEQLRARLNKEYNAFAKTGTAKKPETIAANLKLLQGDLDLESGLDSISKQGVITKGAIFDQRMNEPYTPPSKAESVDDAVNFSMQEVGVADPEYIGKLLGISESEAHKKLTTGERPYLLMDPATEKYVFIDDYLAGNVKRKLHDAEAAGLNANVALLKAVQPKDKTAEQVKASIRSPWLDAGVFEQFLDALGVKASVSVSNTLGKIGIENVKGETKTELGEQFTNEYKITIEKLFNHAATGKALQIYDTMPNGNRVKNDKATSMANVLVNKMIDTFTTWANSSPEVKQRMADSFNERINTHITRSYNGRLYLKTIGQNPKISLRKTQLDGALRMIQSKNVLLDHTVGAGKTFTAITGIMQRKRLGLSKKPMLVVPNHIIESFKTDFYALYPGAKVLSVSEKQMSAKNRKQFFSRIATGDYDAIIIGHSHLKNIPNNGDHIKAVYNEKLDELREALEKAKDEAKANGSRGASVSQIEGSITRLNDKLKEKQSKLAEKEDTIGFDFTDLGVDYMVIDEAHEFKNLMYSTNGDRVVGMNDPKGSEKAMDLLIKTRTIQGLDKSGVTFMTGTPISNSLVEIYTMMYYLGHADLKENNLTHYDAFAGSFIDTQVAQEYTPTGTIKERRVLKGLNNIKELTTKYRQFGDVITQKDMVEIYKQDTEEQNRIKGKNDSTRFPIPNIKGGQRQLATAKATDSQKLYNDYLIARMEGMASITGKEERLKYAKLDNPLWVLSDAKKASLDMRLINPRLERDPTGKVARAAKDVKKTYDEWSEDKGTQLIFSDMGVPTKTAAKNAKEDLVKLASIIMPAKEAKTFVTKSLKDSDGDAYTDTLAEIVERINLDTELDPDIVDKADILARDLESSTITADTGFSVYDDLRSSLIESGIPEKEIAFIHDYNTPAQKSDLFDLVNGGDIRVLIGSTAKMGAGTNVQKKLVALRHMDAPWRPSDNEQREGRIIRQGNMFYERAAKAGNPDGFEVELTAYSTEGSSDPVMWQILERKSSAIEQFRRGEIDEFVEEENSDADSYANFKAQTTGNPIYKMKLTSDGDLLQAQADYTANAMSLDSSNRTVANYSREKANLDNVINTFGGVSIADFDAEAVTTQYLDYKATQEDLLGEWQLEQAKYTKLTAKQKKKVKAPVRPKNTLLHELKNDYSKALKDNIITPLTKALNNGVGKHDQVTGKVKLGPDLYLVADMSQAYIDENAVNISTYIESNGLYIDLFDAKNIKTVTGSPRLIQSMLPGVINNKIASEAKRTASSLVSLDANYKQAKSKAGKALSKDSLIKTEQENQWLDIETQVADLKEEIRRSGSENDYIDSETVRNVKRSSFNPDSVKAKKITVNGKRYTTLGVNFSRGYNGAVSPAHNAKGEYVHLEGHYVDNDNKVIEYKKVINKPKSVPEQDYSFLTGLDKKTNTKPLPVKPWQQPGPVNDIYFKANTNNTKTYDVVSKEEALVEIDKFLKDFSGVDDVKIRVGKTEVETFGRDISKGKGRIFGGYNPTTDTLYIVTGAFPNISELRTTLHHELLVHKGLGLYSEKAQKDILDSIAYAVESKEPTIAKLWQKVLKAYPSNKNTKAVQAEELLALIAEESTSLLNSPKLNRLVLAFRKLLRKLNILKHNVGKAELVREIHKIGQQLALGRKPTPRPDKPQKKSKDNDDVLYRRENNNINVEDEGRKDRYIRIIQDKFRRLKVVQRELPNINDNNDAYMAEEAFHGKVGEDLHKLERDHVEKLAKAMADHNLTQNEVDMYLIAKHAEERNAHIDTISPDLNGAGSGMSNEQAQRILDKAVVEGNRLALEEVASHVYAILEQGRRSMIRHGLEGESVIDGWQDQYQFYVPLKGYSSDEDTKDSAGRKFGTGKGFNIKGRETIRALGRRSLSESPLLHAISDTTQTIIRSRKNEVGNTFLKLVQQNPDKDFWEVFTAENPDSKRGLLPSGEVGVMPMTAYEMKLSDDYFKTKVEGVEQFIKIQDPMLSRAMGNLGVEDSNKLTQVLGKFTRTLSALVTTWNPEFMLTNFSRDIQAAIANALAETQVADGKAKNKKIALDMVLSVPESMKTLRRAFRNEDYSGEMGASLKEFLASGAKTGWANQKDIDGLAKELKGHINRASNTKTGKALRGANAVADFVRDYNDVVENATRFSAYYHARKQGVSVKKASSLAKNLTINFNRKGEIGNSLNAVYMFANASVQGTANMMRALATPKDRSKSMWNKDYYNLTQKLAVGSIFATIAAAEIMRFVGGDDDDGVAFYDKVPDHVKATNFVIMTGGKDYVTIPLPYGYNFLAAIGHSIDGAMNKKPIGKQAANLAFSALSTFSPIGAQDSDEAINSFAKTIAPTVIKPFVEMAVNENFFGSNIYPEQHGFSAKKSDAHTGTKYTWEWTKALAVSLNEMTGGTEYRSGGIDISPQSFDHLIKFMGGGVLQFGARWQNLAVKANKGEELKAGDIPFYRRFSKEVNPKSTIGEFYEDKNRLNKYKAEYKSLKGSDRVSFRKEFSNQLRLQQRATIIEKALRNLNERKRRIESSVNYSKQEKLDKINAIDDRKITLTMTFSKLKNELGLKYLH